MPKGVKSGQLSVYNPSTSLGKLPIRGGNKYYSEMGDGVGDIELPIAYQGMKSVSAKKLQPIASKSELRAKKNTRMTQSLLFNQNLTFVMRKGKVVPTEKYVSSYMMPYTSMDYQSV